MDVNPRDVGSEHHDLVPLFGKRVRVTLARDPELVVQIGILLGYGEGGNVELEGDDGLVYHCWPRLEVTAVEGDVSLDPPDPRDAAELASGDLSNLAPWERDLIFRQAGEQPGMNEE